MPRLFLSAAHKSSGKTTVSIGLCAEFAHRGLRVQPFKKGPDYIDPMWLGRAARRPCYNLDYNTMSSEEILAFFGDRGADADLCLIEGNKGLHDGLALDGRDSNAAVARLLQAPVVLVIDTQGITRGIAPLLLGYQHFDPEVRIGGVILNRVAGERHGEKLRAAVEHYTDIPVLGWVRRATDLVLDERHLGLIPSNEQADADRHIQAIRSRIAEQVDVDALLRLAGTAPPLERPRLPPAPARPLPRLRVGIARDRAFGFYYPDDLETFTRLGAELVPIDLVHDARLPERLDALFIGGGFPETAMEALAANAGMRHSVRTAIEGGLPTYAECGGLMYLARSIRWHERSAEMVGVIPGDVVMGRRPVGRGYIRLRETPAHPWPGDGALPAAGDQVIAAHEFHYSRIEHLDIPGPFAYQVVRGHGLDGTHDGIVLHRLLASYAHLRDTGKYRWIHRFLAFAARFANNVAESSKGTGNQAGTP
ncbi:MAG: cobyrinate a,c-diamide synthase [Gammaproteobacteria bacterium]|nr:MAG: cobyrinate a,c-diamide synthase [Gammaproteobacteria bacterium]